MLERKQTHMSRPIKLPAHIEAYFLNHNIGCSGVLPVDGETIKIMTNVGWFKYNSSTKDLSKFMGRYAGYESVFNSQVCEQLSLI
jgi:hypothetical protein